MNRRRLLHSIAPLALLGLLASAPPQDEVEVEEPRELPWRPTVLHYENSGGEKGRTLLRYDAHGLNDRARWELLDGSRHSENWHTLDPAGRLVRKYREFSDGIKSDLFYDRDASGRLVRERFQRSDGVKGTVDYVYDEDGTLDRADCRGLNGWFHGVIDYELDDEGRKQSARVTRDDTLLGTIAYEYHDHGALAVERWDLGDWSQTFTWEYEQYEPRTPPGWASSNAFVVDTASVRIAREDYAYDGTGGPSTYEYAEDGRLARKVFVRADGLRTETTYDYDGAGLLLSSHRDYGNGLTADFTYRFNGNRRLTHRDMERSDGVTSKERYEYDAKMRLVKARWEGFDSWLSGAITFEHDEAGRPVRGRFESPGMTADLHLSFEEHGNPTRIHWDLSIGHTQTYAFEYEPVE